MHPILLTLGPFRLYSYGLMLAVAFLVASALASRVAREQQGLFKAIPPHLIIPLSTSFMLGGLIGARAFFVLAHWEVFRRYPGEIPAIWHGGLVWYGGLLGGVLSACWYLSVHRLGFLRVADQLIPFVALGHSIGRIGCFLNGCCYGKPTAAWFGVVFPGHTERLIPTQLIESLGLLILYWALRWLQRPALLSRPGRVWAIYLIAYAALRFVVELWRGDQPALWLMGLTAQQLLSAGIGAIGAVLLVVQWTRRQHLP